MNEEKAQAVANMTEDNTEFEGTDIITDARQDGGKMQHSLILLLSETLLIG